MSELPMTRAERLALINKPFPQIRYYGRKYGGGCETYERMPNGQVVQLRERMLFGNISKKPSLRDYEGE